MEARARQDLPAALADIYGVDLPRVEPVVAALEAHALGDLSDPA